MEKLTLKDGKEYLVRINKPNSVRHGRHEIGVYHKEIECFNLNPTIHFSDIDRCIEVDNIEKLEHHEVTTVGLWATDRPDLVKDDMSLMFQIEGDKYELNLINRIDGFCASSLDPETAIKWDNVKKVLFKTRKQLKNGV